MILFLVFLLVAFWLLGMITATTLGGWLHVLPVYHQRGAARLLECPVEWRRLPRIRPRFRAISSFREPIGHCSAHRLRCLSPSHSSGRSSASTNASRSTRSPISIFHCRAS